MARAKYSNTIEFRDATTGFLQRLAGVSITVYEEGTTTPIAKTLYADATSGTTKSNPFTAADDGSFEFYLEGAQNVNIKASRSGYSDQTISYERVHPSFPFLQAYRVFHVADYGATGDGTDQTEAINDAITDMLTNTSQPGGILQFAAGDYAYDNTQNTNVGTLHQLQGKFGYIIRGDGMLATKLYPGVRSDKWANKFFVSLAGAHNCGIEDICIGITAVASQSFPYALLFLGQSPTNGSNALWFKNVRIEAAGKHGLYNYAVPSCHAENLHIYNHECTEATYADDGNVADGAAAYFSRDNTAGLAAPASYDLLDSGDAAYTARSCSDWDMTRTEIHDLTSLAGTANASALAFYQVTNFRIRGNLSSNGNFIKVIAGANGTAIPTDNIVFEGTMYREDLGGGAGLTPLYGVVLENTFSHGTPLLYLGRVNLSNSRIDNKVGDTTAAIFKAPAGSTIARPTLRNWTPVTGYTGKVLDITNNASNVLLHPDIDGCGFDLSVGASGTITGGRDLTNIGTLTYGTLTDGFPTDIATATGDLLYASAARALARRAIGTAGQILSVVSGLPQWASNAILSYFDLTTGAAPSNPASGNRRLYSKTVSSQFQDGHPFMLTSGGTEREILAGTLIASVSRASGTQALVTGDWRTLQWDTEDVDIDSGVALGTDNTKINILSTGTYLIMAGVEFASAAGNFRGLRILQSGAAVKALTQTNPTAGGYPTVFQVIGIYRTNATNTYLQAQAYHDVGSDVNFQATQGASFFSVIRLGPYAA